MGKMERTKQIVKRTATFWVVWSSTFAGLAITLTAVMPSNAWKLGACMIVLGVAVLTVVRDYWLQEDKTRLDVLESDYMSLHKEFKSLEQWEHQFVTLRNTYHAQKADVVHLAQAKTAAVAAFNAEYKMILKEDLKESAESAREDWEKAKRDRDETFRKLEILRDNLVELTSKVLAIETQSPTATTPTTQCDLSNTVADSPQPISNADN